MGHRFLLWTAILTAGIAGAGCATYHVVELGPGVTENNIISPLYAVSRNRVVYPEYVVDDYGNYPTDPQTAWSRFREKKPAAEAVIREKYDVPSAFPGQVPRYFFGFCFALVSPVAIPVRWVSEGLFGKPGAKKSFAQISSDYFSSSFNPPGYEKPRIRERVDYFY
ncbi:MAG: hypothetical protein HY714_01945 [Candidatus Omnitrophica bacterium]|nr:hypothetical protein [Candidatus Omnitrophota bacterium]